MNVAALSPSALLVLHAQITDELRGAASPEAPTTPPAT
jgi:hypothetical protein